MTKISQQYIINTKSDLDEARYVGDSLSLLQGRIGYLMDNYANLDIDDPLGEALNCIDLAQGSVSAKIEELEKEMVE